MRRLFFAARIVFLAAVAIPLHADETRVPVVLSGGHETDPRDKGRPVVLVAGALGVPPETFREAFSRVHPAGPGSGGPTPDEARANKAALMSVLAPLGVTNERLDAVSNRYRYVKSRGELWPVKEARAYAVIVDGKVASFVVAEGGFGYSSPPTVSVPGHDGVKATAQLAFGPEFEKNGALSAIVLDGAP